MTIRTIQHNAVTLARVESETVLITDTESALDLMATVQYQTQSRCLIVDSNAFDARFFDLKPRLAGDILQKFVTYQVKLAIIGDFSIYSSKSLQDCIRESNQGRDIFFVRDEREAIAKLSR